MPTPMYGIDRKSGGKTAAFQKGRHSRAAFLF